MNIYYFELSKGEVSKYIQIQKHIKSLIDKNLVEEGEKLPTIRELSELLGVNNTTIVSAYKKLQSEGYAVMKMGSGTYAKKKEIIKSYKKEYNEVLKSISDTKIDEYIDLAGETSSREFFPVNVFKQNINEVMDRDGKEAFVYQEALGYTGLRKTINSSFWNNSVDLSNILIVSGAQQGIDVVAKALLNVNDNIIMEKPTYSGALTVFKWRRANILDVPMQEDGVNLDVFKDIVKKTKIKFFYTMSYFQNPSTVTYSKQKKEAIIQLAEKYDFYILEDDYISELIYDDNIKHESFRQLDKYNRVIYIKSFSKVFLPGIRIGYLISPDKFTDSIQNSKINSDISTSSLMQRALAIYIERGFFKEHINSVKEAYLNRYLSMKSLLNTYLEGKASFLDPKGGLNFYITLSDKVNKNSISIFEECFKQKVLITPGTIFYKQPSDGNKFIRLSFSQSKIQDIENGIKVIRNILG